MKKLIGLGLYWGLASLGFAQEITITEAWVRSIRQGTQNSVLYLNIHSDQRLSLVGGDSPLTEAVELHSMQLTNDIMSMKKLETITIPSKQWVSFKPGGLHIMLLGFKKLPDKEMNITLHFVNDKQQKIQKTLKVPVVQTGPSKP
ncbi:MAG: copper chaperone PCu(A)C [Gammaproteobacteria bacterium]|nr:copper chaperone PCu(A)C [Gammaproteobacteria bacterium]